MSQAYLQQQPIIQQIQQQPIIQQIQQQPIIQQIQEQPITQPVIQQPVIQEQPVIECSNLTNENNDLKQKLIEMQKKIDFINSLQNNKNSDINCDFKIKKVKDELNTMLKNSTTNYIQLLFNTLLKNQVLSQNEVDNIKYKLEKGDVEPKTIISYLEDKINLSKNIYSSPNDSVFNVKPNNLNMNVLFNNKVQILPRPPVCLTDTPISVKQSDNYSNNYASF